MNELDWDTDFHIQLHKHLYDQDPQQYSENLDFSDDSPGIGKENYPYHDNGLENYDMPSNTLTEKSTLANVKNSVLSQDDEQIILTKINEDGTTSSYFDKRKLKIAPRSTLQFKVGPPFEHVGRYYEVFEDTTQEKLPLKIIPRIDRGFDHIDNEWVGYKRNYFTLVACYETPGCGLDKFLKGTYSLRNTNFSSSTFGGDEEDAKVLYFAVQIKARSDDEQREINLVQHTAKRDKGPQFAPAVCPLIPSPLPRHQVIREASNVRNTAKMKKYDTTFYYHRENEELSDYYDDALVHTYPQDCIQKVARYERVQFASSISVKKPTQQNKHFRLHVLLGAVMSPDENVNEETFRHSEPFTLPDGTKTRFVYLQEMRTPPLIIRGRSPSNYTSSQRLTMRTSSFNTVDDINRRMQQEGNSKESSSTPLCSPPKISEARSISMRGKIMRAQTLSGPIEKSSSLMLNSPIRSSNPKVEHDVQTLDYIEKMLYIQYEADNKEQMLEEKKAIDDIFEDENLEERIFDNVLVPGVDEDGSHFLSHESSIRKVLNGSNEEATVNEKQISIDLKDIELKPSVLPNLDREQSSLIGSLALGSEDQWQLSRKRNPDFCTLSSSQNQVNAIVEPPTKRRRGRPSCKKNSSISQIPQFSEMQQSALGEISINDISLSVLHNNAQNNHLYHLESNIYDLKDSIPRNLTRIDGPLLRNQQEIYNDSFERYMMSADKYQIKSELSPLGDYEELNLFDENSIYK